MAEKPGPDKELRPGDGLAWRQQAWLANLGVAMAEKARTSEVAGARLQAYEKANREEAEAQRQADRTAREAAAKAVGQVVASLGACGLGHLLPGPQPVELPEPADGEFVRQYAISMARQVPGTVEELLRERDAERQRQRQRQLQEAERLREEQRLREERRQRQLSEEKAGRELMLWYLAGAVGYGIAWLMLPKMAGGSLSWSEASRHPVLFVLWVLVGILMQVGNYNKVYLAK